VCKREQLTEADSLHTVLKMENYAPPALFSADLGGCTALADQRPDELVATFIGALTRAGATVVHEVTHSFPGTGLTCVLILTESHAVLHTWPETATANIDIFSCSTKLKSLDAIEDLRRRFGARHVALQEHPRANGHGPWPDRRR
jgi:S-adenosylmethionine decarboxylase